MKNMIITIKGNDYEISDDKNCWKELADIAWDIALSLDKFEKICRQSPEYYRQRNND